MSERSKQMEQIAGLSIIALLIIGSIIIILPFLSVMYFIEIGLTFMPLLAKRSYTSASSSGVILNEPRAMLRFLGTSSSTPTNSNRSFSIS